MVRVKGSKVSEKIDQYKSASDTYYAEVQKLLSYIDKEKQIDGPDQGRLGNISGLLAAQLRRMGEVKSCLNKLQGQAPIAAPLSEPPPIDRSNTKSVNKKRREKKYGANVKPKSLSVPKNKRKEKVRQERNKNKAKREENRDGCTGKKKFGYDEAIVVGSRMLEQSKDPSLTKMAIYWCTKCGQHHLTRQVTRDTKRSNTQVAVLEKVYEDEQVPT
jgi:hypothetical protein